jgi:hypothetical protein
MITGRVIGVGRDKDGFSQIRLDNSEHYYIFQNSGFGGQVESFKNLVVFVGKIVTLRYSKTMHYQTSLFGGTKKKCRCYSFVGVSDV